MKRMLCLLLVIAIFAGCSTKINLKEASRNTKASTQTDVNIQGSKLYVHFIDVGQGDSILLQAPSGKAMLVDAGGNQQGNKVVSYIKAQGINKIDVLIGTHPHEDHIGGMDTVISGMDIGQVYMPKASSNTATFMDVLKAVKTKELKITAAAAGVKVEMDPDLKIQMLSPNSEKYENLNNYSPVIKVTYFENTFILTGDAESLSEGEILNRNFDVRADILKVGHHGSNSSTASRFLKAVSPKYAVISVGKGNDYGHPNKETIDKLGKAGAAILRTDENGSIVIAADGKNITVKMERGTK